MKLSTGTKSLLIGAHWPPHILMVALAWRWVFGQWPTKKEFAAICLHDVGYFGCKEMDGDDGTKHPELGACFADVLLGKQYGDLIRGHSMGYVVMTGGQVSKLYVADKLSHVFEPAWLYTLRTRLTGELEQYRARGPGGAARRDDETVSDEEWFRVVRCRMARGGLSAALPIIAPNNIGADRGR